ncbi:MAG TPA: aldo/keto reductase [Candidatus Sulfotelmatobacter sp.]|jgi:hypothetical protein|nr:aldo/keto reductase [Candidatus Sulfotelmatobacter sp.]
MGYGAMQLAGPGVWGPPLDVGTAVGVLREAIAAGVNHIDTSDFYGPHVTNQIIKQALHPYPDRLVIVSKVGFRRGADKSWLHAVSPQELIDAVHDNLRNLELSTLDLVNLRVGGATGPSGRFGARVSEISGLRQSHITFGAKSYIQLHGKGRKDRSIPLWPRTARGSEGLVSRVGTTRAGVRIPDHSRRTADAICYPFVVAESGRPGILPLRHSEETSVATLRKS